MNIVEAVLLGAVEGITEFLPISSTGHLTILESLLGFHIDADDITAFTAIIQSGAVLATVIFLRKDLIRIVAAWFRGLRSAGARADPDWRFAWAVILGSVPIGIVGLLFQDTVEHTLRSLWWVAGALIGWSGAMAFADHAATQIRRAGRCHLEGHPDHRGGAVPGADPRGVPVGRHHVGRSAARPGPGDGDEAVVLPVHPGPAGRHGAAGLHTVRGPSPTASAG